MTYQSGHKTIFWLPYTPTNFANLSTVSVVMMVMMSQLKFTRSANSAGSNKDMIWLILPSTLWTNYITKSGIPVRKSNWCNSYHSPDPLLLARTPKGNDLKVKTASAIPQCLANEAVTYIPLMLIVTADRFQQPFITGVVWSHISATKYRSILVQHLVPDKLQFCLSAGLNFSWVF